MQIERVSLRRTYIVVAIFAAVALAIVARLIWIQVIDHGSHEAAANRTWSVEINAPRGAILDRNGFPLATSEDTWEVHVDRRVWARTGFEPNETASRLAGLLRASEESVLRRVRDTDGNDAFLAVVAYETGAAIRREQLPGVYVIEDARRRYVEGALAAQVVGITGRDEQGLAGLEYSLDRTLRGEQGLLLFEQDGRGDPIPFGARAERPVRNGSDVVTTLDRNIQRAMDRLLRRAVEKWDAQGGAILVMHAETGDMLAIATLPTYDPSEIDFADDSFDPSLLRSTAATDVYEPGSVFKVVTIAAGLDLNLIEPETTFIDKGAVTIGDRVIRNYDLSFHGEQSMTQVLQKSLNTGTVWVARQIGADRFDEYVTAFGFGAATGAGLPGESDGLVALSGSLGWSESHLATTSFGQGIAATPLQIVQAYGAIANGGELVQPRLVSAVVTEGVASPREPAPRRRVIGEEAAADVAQMMQDSVDGVADHPAQTPGWRVAGKSGTTDVVEGGEYIEGESIASFAGFAPADAPEIVVLIRIDRPQGELLGGIVAAPIFSQVVSEVLPYLGVPATNYVAQPTLFLPTDEEEGEDGAEPEMLEFQPARAREGDAR